MLPIITIGYLCAVLSQHTCTNLTNEQVELAQYAYIRAVDADIDPAKFLKLIDLESGWDKNILGDKGKAFGLLQFWRGTFDSFAKEYGLVGTYKNPYSQILLASRMFDDGLWHHWKNTATATGLNK